mgnify:CR=1 FL=1
MKKNSFVLKAAFFATMIFALVFTSCEKKRTANSVRIGCLTGHVIPIVAEHNGYLAERFPFGADLENTAVYFHCDRARIRNDHRLAGVQVLPLFLVVLQDVVHKGIDCFLGHKDSDYFWINVPYFVFLYIIGEKEIFL